MFKKSRRKIVAAIMSVLVILWVGTLGVIYISSYIEMTRQNESMLRAHADMYVISQDSDNQPPEKPARDDEMRGFEPGFTDTPRFMLTTFYTVAISDSGEVLEVRNAATTVYTDDELEAFALDVYKDGGDYGRKNNLAYYNAEKNGYTLVTFMDNTVVNENALTLFRYTLIFGGAALVLFFFLSLFLARKIVKPLEESYNKQKQFISDAGHELKTPVAVVSANAELLSRELGDNRWLANIQYENERMGMLVTQLLELARTENVEPQKEHLDFSRLVEGEALPFESVAFEKGLTLSSNIAPEINVEGNSTQLRQLVSILIDNAVRHSEAAGEVYLNLSAEHGSARLSVINKGEEIPKEEREKIFERFYRMDTVRNGEDKHYGLGLAIAKAIVISHKGSISVDCYDGLVEFNVKIPKI